MKRLAVLMAALVAATSVQAQQLPSDIPAKFTPVEASFDFTRRTVEIAMRDGVKLHTVILAMKGAKDAPILLDRSPYGAEEESSKNASAHGEMQAGAVGATLLRAGYILVFQDVRGKHGSGGAYVNERPLIGPLNASSVDHSTDAYDTIDWLVKNVDGTNGRVGIFGTSYDGMMAAMALVHPHPALKAAMPANPVINTWMNDDDYHGGAFRLIGYDYYYSQDAAKGEAGDLWRDDYDDYNTFLHAGSASDFVNSHGLGQLGWVRRMHDHPAYDAFWHAQALDEILPKQPQTVPTLWVAGQWDQEDMYGAVAVYEAVSRNDPSHLNHLVIGPWKHGGWAGDGSTLGPVRFDSDTAAWFRRYVMLPFLDANLKTGGTAANLPPVLAFQTGANQWQRLDHWPLACATGCPAPAQRLYLQPAGALGFAPPVARTTETASDSYVSDPAKPIPYRPRPIRPTYAKGSTWGQWLADDQRAFADRTDVLTYQTPALTQPVAISGAAVANLVAATTGTDGDFVVKLIDVYPAEYPEKPEMGGYQLGIAMDIFRGRYAAKGFGHAEPLVANRPTTVRFALPNANHVFLPGHRIMVQVQSSWFPLYDRNPQSYVANIFDAKPGDYRKATVTLFHSAREASFVELPVVAATSTATPAPALAAAPAM
ncbi:CocE/NonD family hydrolase [Sphingomonas bacterium]|uniref:CocE/NonD family hydrolase n=1 Tax=Sphingomonas bacterium TaxID=1895847 RepID=UPI0015773DF8|nr:CocE/NonD family hydrolase [Sphingomonas bacterium]